VEEAVDGREIGRGTTFPGSDDAVFEKLGITSLRNEILEGPPSGESSPKSIRKELKANENEEQWDSEEGKAEASSTVPSSHLLGSFDHSSDAKRTEESVSEKSESGGGGERGNWPRKKAEQEESVLLRVLMDGYEKDVRPVRNASQPILIEVGITLTQIFDMVSPRTLTLKSRAFSAINILMSLSLKPFTLNQCHSSSPFSKTSLQKGNDLSRIP